MLSFRKKYSRKGPEEGSTAPHMMARRENQRWGVEEVGSCSHNSMRFNNKIHCTGKKRWMCSLCVDKLPAMLTGAAPID